MVFTTIKHDFVKSVFIFFLAHCFLLNAFAQPVGNREDVAWQYLAERGEVYFSFSLPEDVTRIQEILNHLSVDMHKEDTVFAYAGKEAFHKFLSYGIDYEVLLPPGLAYTPSRMKSWEDMQATDLTESWNFYPTYDAYVQLMHHFEETYPGRVKIYNIGETASGNRELLFAKIQPDVNVKRAVPQFMYTSTMHGDETVGYVLSLRLIHFLITQYGERDDVTYLLDNLEIWICPNENPDGTYTNNNATVHGATRFNANGVDLNRNYPNPIAGPPQARQPETTAMISFTDTMNFIMSANMHGGAELVNYPFDSWRSNIRKHADHNWFDLVSKEYADTAQTYSPNNYLTDLGGYTHGGDWYVILNSRQDYMNYYRSIREVTLELSGEKLLAESQLDPHWEYNYRSLLNYMKQATYGISGVVYDKSDSQPLKALIEVTGHDQFGSAVSSSPSNGYFHRPVSAGTWNLRVSAEGYDTKEINEVEVMANGRVTLDVPLEKSVSVPDVSERSFTAGLLLNPIQALSAIDLSIPFDGRLRVELINMNGRVAMVLLDEVLPAGRQQKPIGRLLFRQAPGIYMLRLIFHDSVMYLPCMIQ
jgi:murein tripeptide amidase MpaA